MVLAPRLVAMVFPMFGATHFLPPLWPEIALAELSPASEVTATEMAPAEMPASTRKAVRRIDERGQ
jgi:hypothetical protein